MTCYGLHHPSSTTSAFGPRCDFCGVFHLGADGRPIVCPKLQPQNQPPPVQHCPGCPYPRRT